MATRSPRTEIAVCTRIHTVLLTPATPLASTQRYTTRWSSTFLVLGLLCALLMSAGSFAAADTVTASVDAATVDPSSSSSSAAAAGAVVSDGLARKVDSAAIGDPLVPPIPMPRSDLFSEHDKDVLASHQHQKPYAAASLSDLGNGNNGNGAGNGGTAPAEPAVAPIASSATQPVASSVSAVSLLPDKLDAGSVPIVVVLPTATLIAPLELAATPIAAAVATPAPPAAAAPVPPVAAAVPIPAPPAPTPTPVPPPVAAPVYLPDNEDLIVEETFFPKAGAAAEAEAAARAAAEEEASSAAAAAAAMALAAAIAEAQKLTQKAAEEEYEMQRWAAQQLKLQQQDPSLQHDDSHSHAPGAYAISHPSATHGHPSHGDRSHASTHHSSATAADHARQTSHLSTSEVTDSTAAAAAAAASGLSSPSSSPDPSSWWSWSSLMLPDSAALATLWLRLGELDDVVQAAVETLARSWKPTGVPGFPKASPPPPTATATAAAAAKTAATTTAAAAAAVASIYVSQTPLSLSVKTQEIQIYIALCGVVCMILLSLCICLAWRKYGTAIHAIAEFNPTTPQR